MELVRMLVLTVIFTVTILGNAFAINLTPGDYEIKNWIETVNGGTGKLQKKIEHIENPEEYFRKMFAMERCEELSKSITSDTLTIEVSCRFSPPVTISSHFTFNGDSFEGKSQYRYTNNGVLKVGMRGTKVVAAKPPSTEKTAEIDQKLREIWGRMTSYLSSSDIDKAVELFHPDKRKERRSIFEGLKNQLPLMVNDMIELNRRRINDDKGYAIYELVTREGGHRTAYEVVFQKDQNDKWYIVDF